MERFITTLTDSGSTIEETRVVEISFDPYIVKVRLGDNNQFLGISEIQLNKNFFDNKLKYLIKEGKDIEEFYRK